MTSGPLRHVRIVDLTDLRGALAGRMLGDLGADVVAIEPPGGAPDRLRPPFAGGTPDPDMSLAFRVRHASKRHCVLDRDTAAGRERLAGFLDHADVLIENLGAADREVAGLSVARVRTQHPHLIHVAIADCGLDGPRAGWRLEPLPALAASGALFASGPSDAPPCGVPGFLAHDCAATLAAVGALVALRDRARSGTGQTVEVSVEEAALALLAPWGIPLPDYAHAFPLLPPELPRDGDGPAVVVPARDGFVRLVAITPTQWRGLLRLLAGRTPPVRESEARRTPAAHDDAPVTAALARVVARLPLAGAFLPALQTAEALLRHAAAALRHRTRADLLEAAHAHRVPLAPVHTPGEFVDAPQTRHRRFFTPLALGPLGIIPVAPFPCRLERTPAQVRHLAPLLADPDAPGFPEERTCDATGSRRAPAGLTDLRVANLGVGAVVPELCRQLAELGADVVKLEPIGHLDFLRRLTVDPGSPNHAPFFNDTARGQRSVALDLATPQGRALALRLCAAADVVAENRATGTVAAWGLGYDDVRAVRPDVVYVSSQGYGADGPLATAPAYGPLAAAFAGVSWLWSHPGATRPVGTWLEHPDHYAARLLAVAVLAALEHRRRTGEGQRIELAQTEAAAFAVGERYAMRAHAERGNAAVHACPHGVYPAAGTDRWIAIAVADDRAWHALRGSTGWPDEPALRTLAGRLARRSELDARVGAWTQGRDAMAAATTLQAAGVSAMAVRSPCALRADRHFAARGTLVSEYDPAGIGAVRHVGNPLRMGATPAGPAGPAPALGAHTAEVLAAWLGEPAP